jgi:hypothetical protein
MQPKSFVTRRDVDRQTEMTCLLCILVILVRAEKADKLETTVGISKARCAALCTQKLLPVIGLDSQPLDLCGLHNRQIAHICA